MTDPQDHHRRRVLCGVALIASLPLLGQRPEAAQSPVASGVRATRLPQNPLITLKSSSTLGDNINGPSVIRVP